MNSAQTTPTVGAARHSRPITEEAVATALGRASIHRAPAIQLPADARHAAALVLAYVQEGDTSFDRSAAIEAMAARVAKLKGSDGDQAEEELLAHAAILDGLFSRYTAEAMNAKMVEHRVKFQKLALQCQGSYARSIIAVEALRAQRRGAAALTIPNSERDADS